MRGVATLDRVGDLRSRDGSLSRQARNNREKNGILIVLFCMGTKLPDGAGQ
jgi:hypothetical protein